jgi:hypothetical protein
VWGRGIEEVGDDEGIHKRVVWDMENFLWRVMGGMEKYVCTWYVILMEDEGFRSLVLHCYCIKCRR